MYDLHLSTLCSRRKIRHDKNFTWFFACKYGEKMVERRNFTIYAAFRSGNSHAVSLHVLPNKFRIIDNKEKSKSLRFT
jgi:hypothetical protein